jgi:hypothetical protein
MEDNAAAVEKVLAKIRQQNMDDQQKLVRAFNEKNKPGTPVLCWPGGIPTSEPGIHVRVFTPAEVSDVTGEAVVVVDRLHARLRLADIKVMEPHLLTRADVYRAVASAVHDTRRDVFSLGYRVRDTATPATREEMERRVAKLESDVERLSQTFIVMARARWDQEE